MPNALHIVNLNGGVVTSRDPSRLINGELTKATNIEYEPASPSVNPLPGRTSFGSAVGEADPDIVGLYHADFDSGTNRLVARTSTTWESAAAGTSGTFAILVSGLSTATYGDGCHYLNQHFLYDGVASNRVLTSGNTLIAHGLATRTANVTAATAAGAGLTAGSTYTVWATEYDSTNDLESTFTMTATGNVSTVSIHASSGNNRILVTSPTAINSSANQYIVYATVAGGAFPTGYKFGPTTFGTDTTISSEPGSGSNIEPFQYVQVGGITYGRNGQPPRADCMEVFEDSLCLIDSTDKQKLRYSESDLPHYFPAVYYIGFETAFQDELRSIKAVGNSLLAFLRTQVWRIDYLPRGSDSEFIRGRVKEPISLWHGCLSPRGPVVFEIYGGQQLCAFPSAGGWMVTDGYRTDTLTDDLAWASTVSITSLDTAITKNNPVKQRLELYYNDGSTRHKCLHAHYHPTKIKREGAFGKFVVTGPHDVPGQAAAQGFLSTNEFVTWTAANDDVYLENRGNTDAASLVDSSTTIRARVQSPRMYLAGPSGEFIVSRAFIQHDASSLDAALLSNFYREPERTVISRTNTFNLSATGCTPIELNDSAYNYQFVLTATGDFGAIHYVSLEVTPQGVLEGI